MALTYIGPNSLRQMFEREYQTIASDYDRRDATIIVETPPPPLYEGDKNYGIYKIEEITIDDIQDLPRTKSQKRFIAFNKKINELLELSNSVKRKNASHYVETEFLSKLFELEDTWWDISVDGCAFYMPTRDTCYFYPYEAIFSLCDETAKDVYTKWGENFSEESNFNFADAFGNSIKHELVHNDIGECLPDLEMRLNHQEMLESTKNLMREANIKTIHVTALESILSEKTHRLKSLYSKQIRLMITLLGEALACNYTTYTDDMYTELTLGYIAYNEWLTKHPIYRHFIGVGSELFERVRQKILSQGKLETLKETKRIINKAWSENKNCLCI